MGIPVKINMNKFPNFSYILWKRNLISHTTCSYIIVDLKLKDRIIYLLIALHVNTPERSLLDYTKLYILQIFQRISIPQKHVGFFDILMFLKIL